jgi:ATP-dependent DNA helicase RecG
MTLDEVQDIVESGESPQVEFKRSTGQRSAAARTVCAMLNGTGGHVLFGVTDDRDIVGQEVSDSTRQDIAHELGQIEPQVVLDPGIVPIEGDRAVIVISVPGDRTGPYTYDGRPYVRQGPTTRQMDQDTYERRLVENRDPRRRWEARPTSDIGVGDLDASEITRTISAAIDRGRMEEPGTRDAEDLLRGLGLLRNDRLLNAAVVLFGEDHLFMPDYPQCLLRMARFRGTTKSEFEDNRQVRGNAFNLFEQAQRFLREHLPIASEVRPHEIEREDTPLYPMEALREALANALCHRDYGLQGGSIGVAIYDDRLEITNTGTLPPGITIEELTEPHTSQIRNDLIADTFYRRGIIEQWGRGTVKMVELTEEAGLVPPEFEERGGEIVVRFRPVHYVPPTRIEHDLSDLQREILKIVAKAEEASLSDILEALGDVPRRTVQDNLQTLRSLDLVELEGRGRGARWRLADGE